MNLPRAIADPAVLGRCFASSSAGLAVAAAGCLLIASFAVFMLERRSPSLRRGMRLLVRTCSLVLLVIGVALLEHSVLARLFHVAPFVASLIGAAFIAAAVAAAVVVAAGPIARSRPRPRSVDTPPERQATVDWTWVVQLIDLTDMTELQHFIVERLTGVLHAAGGAILLGDAAGSAYEMAYSTAGHDVLGERPTLPADCPLAQRAAKRREPIARAALAGGRADAAVLDDLESLRAELVVPLISHRALLGMVALGPCLDAAGYSDAAVERVRGEAEIIAAAIENARFYNAALQDKFRTDILLEQLALGVIAADSSGTIVACNRAARQILGLRESPEGRPAAALGRALAALVDPGRIADEPTWPQEMVLNVRGRGEIPVRLRGAVVRGPLDLPGGLLVVEDLSERRALEADLRGAKRLASVSTLAAEMAHEIRNPLVSIKTFTQLLPERLDDREFQLKFSQIAQREVDAIGRIIERLLKYAEPTKLARAPVHLEQLVRDMLDLVTPEVRAQRIVVETDFEPNAPQVSLDADKVNQVLRNVITNAIQAMPAGGRLRITTVLPGRRLGAEATAYRVIIRDSGCGVPKAKLEKVFEPFFTTRERGFGLGLSRAKHVMEEHGGSIGIESTPGRGTTVTLSFPLAVPVTESERSTV